MGTAMNVTNNGVGAEINAAPIDLVSVRQRRPRRNPLVGAYVSLLMLMVVYCARPEDWIPGLAVVPLAKIAGVLVLFAFLFSIGQFRFSFPREVIYLLLLVGQLFLASMLSPVWRGGALMATLEFAKVLLIVIVMALVLNTAKRLRRLIFIQAASVAVIATVIVLKGRMLGNRLEGMPGATYADPNDLALTIVISIPLCLALLFLSKSWLRKAAWGLAIVVMLYAVFMTGSRGGFVSLLVTAGVFLWEFAIEERRRYLLVLAVLVGAILSIVSGGLLIGRLKGTFNQQEGTAAAYDSVRERQQLFWRSVEVSKAHPIFGVGPGNFKQLSGNWHVTHNSFTEMSSEGGIPALILQVLILWHGFKNLRGSKRLARGRTGTNVLARALHVSLAGYVFGSLFLSWAFLFLPYILVAYTTALFSIARKSAIESRKNESARQATVQKKLFASTPEREMAFRAV